MATTMDDDDSSIYENGGVLLNGQVQFRLIFPGITCLDYHTMSTV